MFFGNLVVSEWFMLVYFIYIKLFVIEILNLFFFMYINYFRRGNKIGGFNCSSVLIKDFFGDLY